MSSPLSLETAQLELSQPDRQDGVPIVREIELMKEYPVANTFIQFSAPRSTSLEKFLGKRQAQSCPASRMVSMETPRMETLDETQAVTHWPATPGSSLEEEFNERPTVPSRMASVDEEQTQWPATRGPSLDEEEDSLAPVRSALPVEKEF